MKYYNYGYPHFRWKIETRGNCCNCAASFSVTTVVFASPQWCQTLSKVAFIFSILICTYHTSQLPNTKCLRHMVGFSSCKISHALSLAIFVYSYNNKSSVQHCALSIEPETYNFSIYLTRASHHNPLLNTNPT